MDPLGNGVQAKQTGQPPIHPCHIAAAILYGLYRVIRSSRKLEEACCYRLDFIWLLERRRIDHTTFSQFRMRFHGPLKGLFRQIGRVAMNLGLIRLCEVAFNVIKLMRAIEKMRADCVALTETA